jgi:hypothetical protein
LQLLSNGNEIEYLKQPVAMVAKRGTWSRLPVAEHTRSQAARVRGCARGNHVAVELKFALMKGVAKSGDKSSSMATKRTSWGWLR